MFSALRLICAAAALAASATVAAAQTLASPGVGTWYRASDLDRRATPNRALYRSLAWRTAGPGVNVAELDIVVSGGPLNVHTILVRLDPDSLRADLVQLTDRAGMRGVWTVDSAATDVRVAVNAGQFLETGAWGWIVRNGRELAGPRTGPLAAAIAFDAAGTVHWLDDADVAYIRNGRNPIVSAFQSWPRLIDDGTIPAAVVSGSGMDAKHRDARLAVGQLANGHLLLALTRFGVRESIVSRVPIGLTTREMAALMGAIGCTNALMLDGGLSAQMLVREAGGPPEVWRGARRVPVALVFRDR